MNLISYLGYFTYIDTRNLLNNINAQLSSLGPTFLLKTIRRFSTWPNYNLRNNQIVKPILDYYQSIKDNESIISKLKLFKSVCILDGKFSSEATGTFIKDIGEELRATEEFTNGPYFQTVLDHLLFAKSTQKSVLISKIHKSIIENPFSNYHLVLYLSFLGRLEEDLSIYSDIETLLSNVTTQITSQVKPEDVLNILNLFRIKKSDETDFINSTFDIMKNKLDSLTYNNSLKTYKNSLLKCLSSRFQEISDSISDKIGQEIQNSRSYGKDFNYLLILTNFCDESVADNFSNLIVTRIQEGLNSYRFCPNVLNDWVENRQDYVKYKIRNAISSALLSKINIESLGNMSEKIMFKLFLNLNDLYFDRKDEASKNKYMELQNYIRVQPKFRENLSRSLFNSTVSNSNVSNISLSKCTSILREEYSNKQITVKQLDQLIQIVFNVITNRPNVESIFIIKCR